MKLENLILVLCTFALSREIKAVGMMGPVGNIIIESVYECSAADKPTGDDIIFKVDLVNINRKGDRALNVVFENKISIDGSTNFSTDLFNFENGNWKKFYNFKGGVCRDFKMYAETLWSKILGAFQPEVNQLCPIPPGSYKIDKFQANSKDLQMKTIFYGKLKMKVIVIDKNGRNILCVVVEGDSQSIMGLKPHF